jgi:hypothetical protein
MSSTNVGGLVLQPCCRISWCRSGHERNRGRAYALASSPTVGVWATAFSAIASSLSSAR